MPKVEIKRKLRLTRQEVSERLIALGNALADGSEIELTSGGDSIELAVGDSIEWELEIEIDGDETELEIELKWKDTQESEAAVGAVVADSDAQSDSGSDDDGEVTALELTAIEELDVAAELEEDAETRLEVAAELEREAAAELIVAAALEDYAEMELETAGLPEVETFAADDNPEAEGEAAAGTGQAR